MEGKWKFLLVLSICITIPMKGLCEFDELDDEEDGYVEDVQEEPVVREKAVYVAPTLTGPTHFTETFDSKAGFKKKWMPSQSKKEDFDEAIAKYDGKWAVEEPTDNPLEGDQSLALKSKAKHHAISAKLDKTYRFSGKPFIVQYEVKFQNGIDCGGAYIKLLSKTDKLDLKTFHDKTPYTIMFGPDKCGLDHKLHFIFRHKNPKTGEFEEKHAKKPTANIDSNFSDKKPHVYTLVINPDNSFEVLIDNKVVNSGSLLEDMSPPVNPPKEIDDPTDKKPKDWDEREQIADPEASKPEDWDESEPAEIKDEDAVKPEGWLDDEQALIGDPDAEKPDDWDEEMDGEWEAPLIDNPACKDAPGCGEWIQPMKKNPKFKGKWVAPMIDNPQYQGIWKPKRILNPDFFEDLEPYKMTPIEAIGLELWSMSDDIMFDNFLITDSREVATSWTAQTWDLKDAEMRAASSGYSVVRDIIDITNERPWLWAVFLLLVILPLVLLIAYCCMPKSEDSIWSSAMSAAEQRPWLWAVYCVVFLLPIVLLSICLCPRSGPVKQEDLDAARKKTDEATPDDEPVQQEEQKTEPEVGPGGDNSAKPKKSKAALETEEDGAEDEEEEAEDLSQEDVEDKTDSPRRSPRKRRSRKD